MGWDKILMITLILSKKLGGYKIMRNTVAEYTDYISASRLFVFLDEVVCLLHGCGVKVVHT